MVALHVKELPQLVDKKIEHLGALYLSYFTI